MRSIALLIALAIFLPSGAMADTYGQRAYPVRIISKFFRGGLNVGMSPIEIWANSYKEAHKAQVAGDNIVGIVVGYSTGIVTGIGYMGARIGVGLYDMLTFPMPSAPLMQPATPAFTFEWMSDENATANSPAGEGTL